jgi:hypothetical protein
MSERAHHPPQVPMDQVARSMIEAQADSMMAERLKLAEDKLRMAEERQKRWWTEWVKPGFVLPATVIALGALRVYWGDQEMTQSRFSEQAAAMTTMVNEMHAGFKIVDDRATVNLPIIKATQIAVEQQKLINDSTNDRFQNMAMAVQDMRRSVEALRDAVQKTREEMISNEAKRQREGRLMTGPHSPRPDTPDDGPIAR